jgi:hypothetical protein
MLYTLGVDLGMLPESALNATAMRKRFVDRQRNLMTHQFLANPSYFICGFLMVQTSS